MTVRNESSRTQTSAGWRFTEWLFGIVGGIATFLGLFILFAGEDQYVGIGGDVSWRVGDIDLAWAYGLLIGGGLLLLIALGMVIFGRAPAAGQTRMESTGLSDLLWHTGIFVVVNAFIWLQDIAIGGGVDYAFWVTIPWAIGLGIHALVYMFSPRPVETLPERTMGEESRELQHH